MLLLLLLLQNESSSIATAAKRRPSTRAPDAIRARATHNDGSSSRLSRTMVTVTCLTPSANYARRAHWCDTYKKDTYYGKRLSALTRRLCEDNGLGNVKHEASRTDTRVTVAVTRTFVTRTPPRGSSLRTGGDSLR